MESYNLESLIKKYDTQNVFDVIKNFPSQLQNAVSIGKSITIKNIDKSKIKNIIITGLGGSAIGGDLIKLYSKDSISVPVIVNRDYFLPKFVSENTLVIISSYSGNTEETISAYEDAIKKDAQVVCISTGGKVKEMANANNHTLVTLPTGYQPRLALGLMFFCQLYILIKLDLIKESVPDIEETMKLITDRSKEYSNYSVKNEALALAEKMHGKFTFIYSTPNTETLGVRWRGQMNENAKAIVSTHTFPELCHNEIVAWTKDGGLGDTLSNSLVIFLKDKDDYDRVTYRTKVTREIFEKTNKNIIEYSGKGASYLSRMFDLMYLIDWSSYYLAILNGVDPAEIKNIVQLKEKLSQYK
jgi:glucose/mannose-6-phosphate isomerase